MPILNYSPSQRVRSAVDVQCMSYAKPDTDQTILPTVDPLFRKLSILLKDRRPCVFDFDRTSYGTDPSSNADSRPAPRLFVLK